MSDHRDALARTIIRRLWKDAPSVDVNLMILVGPAVILDPFVGTGTVPMVARALGRFGVGLDLSADYLRLAHWRVFESGHAEKSERRSA